jgi:hypothetical protein
MIYTFDKCIIICPKCKNVYKIERNEIMTCMVLIYNDSQVLYPKMPCGGKNLNMIAKWKRIMSKETKISNVSQLVN